MEETEQLEENLLLTLRSYLSRKRELGRVSDADTTVLDLIYDLEGGK